MPSVNLPFGELSFLKYNPCGKTIHDSKTKFHQKKKGQARGGLQYRQSMCE